MSQEEKDLIVTELEAQLAKSNLSLTMSFFYNKDTEKPTEELFQLFSMDEKQKINFLGKHLAENLTHIALSDTYSDVQKTQTEFRNTIQTIRNYIDKYQLTHYNFSQKRKEPEPGSNRYSSFSKNKKSNTINNAEQQKSFSQQEKAKIIASLEKLNSNSVLDSIKLFTEARDGTDDSLFNILQMNMKDAKKELTKKILSDLYSAPKERLEVNMEEEDALDDLIDAEIPDMIEMFKEINEGVKIIRDFVEDYINQHTPPPPTPSQ